MASLACEVRCSTVNESRIAFVKTAEPDALNRGCLVATVTDPGARVRLLGGVDVRRPEQSQICSLNIEFMDEQFDLSPSKRDLVSASQNTVLSASVSPDVIFFKVQLLCTSCNGTFLLRLTAPCRIVSINLLCTLPACLEVQVEKQRLPDIEVPFTPFGAADIIGRGVTMTGFPSASQSTHARSSQPCFTSSMHACFLATWLMAVIPHHTGALTVEAAMWSLYTEADYQAQLRKRKGTSAGFCREARCLAEEEAYKRLMSFRGDVSLDVHILPESDQ